MAFNLAALASLAAALLAAVLLFRRHTSPGAAPPPGGALNTPGTPITPTPAHSTPNVCAHCGLSAAYFTSFTCPRCARDVRDTGLGPPRGPRVASPFWLAVAFTTAYLIAATVASNILFEILPRVYTVSRNTTMRVSSPKIEGVELFLESSGPDEHSTRGTLTGELYAAGGIVVLDVALPAARWRLLDADAKPLDAGDRLTTHAVLRWLELAGVPVDDPVSYSDAAHIADAVARLAGVKLDPMVVPAFGGRPLSLSYSSSSGGGGHSRHDPRWTPLLLMAAAALWLAVIAAIFRRRPAPAAGSVDAPPPPPAAAQEVSQ